MPSSIGAQLHSMRLASKLTQAALASRIGYTASAVCHVERGSRMPGREMIEAWVAACGGHYEVSGPEVPVTPDHAALLDAAAELDADWLALLAEAVRGLAVVQGADRVMARQTLVWLAERAPSASAAVAPETATRPHEEVHARLSAHAGKKAK